MINKSKHQKNFQTVGDQKISEIPEGIKSNKKFVKFRGGPGSEK